MELTRMNQGLNQQESAAAPARSLPCQHEEVNPMYRSVAIAPGGAVREAVRVDMGIGNSVVNNIVQFDIANTVAGAVDELVRIGSHLGQPDSFKQFNTTKSGVDSVNGIADNFGTNLLKCQGFSLITSNTPLFIRTIKLISADTTQLNQQFQHKMILPDFTIIPLVQNIAFTREKSDQATDLLVAKGSWLLNSRNFLEFTSKATKSLTVILELASISDVGDFVQFQK
jgi:hypothetical protein